MYVQYCCMYVDDIALCAFEKYYVENITKIFVRNMLGIFLRRTVRSRTVTKDMISNARYFWRGKFYPFSRMLSIQRERSADFARVLTLVKQPPATNLPIDICRKGTNGIALNYVYFCDDKIIQLLFDCAPFSLMILIFELFSLVERLSIESSCYDAETTILQF